MNQIERDELTKTIIGALQAQRDIDGTVHKQHHDFIETQIIMVKEGQETRRAIKKQVMGWGIIVLLTAMGTVCYDWFVHFIEATKGK